MHHTLMVRNVFAGLKRASQQEQSPTETPTVVQAPVDHVENMVQNNQQQLVTQLHKMQAMMQAMQMQYYPAPHGTRQDFGGHQYYGGRGYHRNQYIYCG